nr:unnamed protein product [Digitaria exilis]
MASCSLWPWRSQACARVEKQGPGTRMADYGAGGGSVERSRESRQSRITDIVMFLSDMSGRSPLYKKAYVFFSSPVHKELVAQIKKDSSVLPRIGALSEMNLEFFAIDSQEFPRVHYRVAKTIDACTMTTLRDLVPTKLAASVSNCLEKYKTTIPEFPQTETCELLIVDRSIDQIAPIIHEWTYDAMCHDLLCMDGNKYILIDFSMAKNKVPSKNGPATEKKEVLLEDHDPVWLELRHAHIADASERLHDKMTNFISKNKAAQLHQARFTDLMQGVSRENKLRLLMIYAALNPEKFESDKGAKLMQVNL